MIIFLTVPGVCLLLGIGAGIFICFYHRKSTIFQERTTFYLYLIWVTILERPLRQVGNVNLGSFLQLKLVFKGDPNGPNFAKETLSVIRIGKIGLLLVIGAPTQLPSWPTFLGRIFVMSIPTKIFNLSFCLSLVFSCQLNLPKSIFS